MKQNAVESYMKQRISATADFKCWKCQNRARESTQFAYFRLELCKQTAAVAAPAAVVSLRIRSMPYICMALYGRVFICAQDLSNCPTFISISYWYKHVCNYLCWLRCVCSAFRSQSHCFFSFVFAHLYFIRSIPVCYSLTTRFEPDSGIGSFFEPFFNMHLYVFEFVFVFHDVNGLLFAHNVKLQCRTLYAYRSDLYSHICILYIWIVQSVFQPTTNTHKRGHHMRLFVCTTATNMSITHNK